MKKVSLILLISGSFIIFSNFGRPCFFEDVFSELAGSQRPFFQQQAFNCTRKAGVRGKALVAATAFFLVVCSSFKLERVAGEQVN